LKPSARDWPNTFVRRSRRGNLIIFQRRGREIIPLYLLRKTVIINRRLDVYSHMQDEVGHFERRMIDMIEEHLEEVL
jgi:hypothetical protein